jgi:hypothetical protein
MKPTPGSPDGTVRIDTAISMNEAVGRSEPLARLAERLRESNARFVAIVPLLPPGLGGFVRPGPLDETGWSLLAANSAVAAKLRQVVPRVEQALKQSGWQPCAVRVKIVADLAG